MASQQVQSNIIHDVGYLATKAVRYDKYQQNITKAMRTYRAKIKQDENKYTASKERARSYMEKYREEKRKNPVEWEQFLTKQRENQKRYREKMKAELERLRNPTQTTQATQTFTQTTTKSQWAC